MTGLDAGILENPVWSSLAGAHASLARVLNSARRYPGDVSVLSAVAPGADAIAWQDLRTLQQSGERTVLFGPAPRIDAPPPGWEVALEFSGLQLVAGERVVGVVDPDAVTLGTADVPDMLDLVARTEPGPFGPGTHRMGNFVGFRDPHDGRLLAMAGERLRPTGWVEISAVCTDPSARGRGLASRLLGTVVAGIRAGGSLPMLHVAGTNHGAIRVYEQLGFEVSRAMYFTVLS